MAFDQVLEAWDIIERAGCGASVACTVRNREVESSILSTPTQRERSVCELSALQAGRGAWCADPSRPENSEIVAVYREVLISLRPPPAA